MLLRGTLVLRTWGHLGVVFGVTRRLREVDHKYGRSRYAAAPRAPQAGERERVTNRVFTQDDHNEKGPV
jgi:hypothetical protein